MGVPRASGRVPALVLRGRGRGRDEPTRPVWGGTDSTSSIAQRSLVRALAVGTRQGRVSWTSGGRSLLVSVFPALSVGSQSGWAGNRGGGDPRACGASRTPYGDRARRESQPRPWRCPSSGRQSDENVQVARVNYLYAGVRNVYRHLRQCAQGQAH